MFATLDKERLNVERIKSSILVAVRHTMDQLSRLWIYPWAVYEQQT